MEKEKKDGEERGKTNEKEKRKMKEKKKNKVPHPSFSSKFPLEVMESARMNS